MERVIRLGRAFIRTTVSPRDGAALQLQLSLPDTQAPLSVNGKVRGVQHAAPGKDAGFWVEFDALAGLAAAAEEVEAKA